MNVLILEILSCKDTEISLNDMYIFVLITDI